MIYLKSSVGIEIRREDLVLSCLRSNFAAGVFTHSRRILNYRQRDREEVRREVDQFFKSGQLNRDNIVLGIPRGDVTLRYVDLPKEVEDNLKQVILYQVQSFEPSEEEKLYYDYVLLKSSVPARKLNVLLVMIRKSILDAHLRIMSELGVRPVCVTIGAVALANMFLGARNDAGAKTFILADLQPAGIEIAVLRNGAMVFTREAAREENAPWRDLLLRELDVALGKVRMGSEESIESVVMAGEASEDAHREILEAVPECELVKDRVRFEMPPQNKMLLQGAATSVGLAYSGLTRRPPIKLNLLPAALRVHQTRWAYVPTIVLSLAIAVALAGLAFRQMIQERTLIRMLDQEILALKPRVDRVQALRSQADALEKRIRYTEGLLQGRDMNLEILQELTTLLPPDTFLKTYRNTDCSLQLMGASPAVPDLIPKLEKSPWLKDVTQRGIIYKDAQSGKDQFTIEAKCEK